jgi:hypothetical protein
MSCTTLTVFDISMATTQFATAERNVRVWAVAHTQESQQRHPIMNWVVVTYGNGMRQLRFQWCVPDSDS